MSDRWHEEVLDGEAIRAAGRLAAAAGELFYLAGGTGLALRVGHRISLDYDLFSERTALDLGGRERVLSVLRRGGNVEIREASDGTLHLLLGKTFVSLFDYPYPLLGPTERWRGIRVASIQDIAAMKVSAVLGRGTRKDFIDLYWICRRRGLEFALDATARKFPDYPDILVQACRALVYFDDAERDPVPRTLHTIPWERVREYFEKHVPAATKKRVLRSPGFGRH